MLTEAKLLEQNRKLREENDELHEVVRQLHERLAEKSIEPLPENWPYLTRHEDTVARRLLAGKGQLVTREDLYCALYGMETEREQQIVLVMVSRLRKKLVGKVLIETVWGRGYRLINLSLGQVKETLSGAVHTGVSAHSETQAA